MCTNDEALHWLTAVFRARALGVSGGLKSQDPTLPYCSKCRCVDVKSVIAHSQDDEVLPPLQEEQAIAAGCCKNITTVP
jgi:hypothetical protein